MNSSSERRKAIWKPRKEGRGGIAGETTEKGASNCFLGKEKGKSRQPVTVKKKEARFGRGPMQGEDKTMGPGAPKEEKISERKQPPRETRRPPPSKNRESMTEAALLAQFRKERGERPSVGSSIEKKTHLYRTRKRRREKYFDEEYLKEKRTPS